MAKTASMTDFSGHPSYAQLANSLIGRKIVDIRYLDDDEMDEHGWLRRCPVLVLDDKTIIYPTENDEMSSAGSLLVKGRSGPLLSLPTSLN